MRSVSSWHQAASVLGAFPTVLPVGASGSFSGARAGVVGGEPESSLCHSGGVRRPRPVAGLGGSSPRIRECCASDSLPSPPRSSAWSLQSSPPHPNGHTDTNAPTRTINKVTNKKRSLSRITTPAISDAQLMEPSAARPRTRLSRSRRTETSSR